MEDCTNGQYYPHPTSCNLFYICVNGRPITQNCAPGLHWNQAQQICDWSHNVPCTKTQQITKVDPTKMSCEDGSYDSYPGDCNKYLTCLWGTYTTFSCAPGLHWNNVQKICDWPRNVNCEDNLPSPIEVETGENEIEEEFSKPTQQTTRRTTTMRTTTPRRTTSMRPMTTTRRPTTAESSVSQGKPVAPPTSAQSGKHYQSQHHLLQNVIDNIHLPIMILQDTSK
ncbi:UNVERIFIED_CONTAM: hypothetical protein PYX00_010247 [Menopon gallinae]|uniref:Chitin-binding type-2 domain-containing protein n=1 Tax=Menopon gallinae TaxID=328185 RepID=A0AAW2HEN1_9NEOP